MPRLDIRLIDFAHTCHVDEVEALERVGADQGMIRGLNSLIEHLGHLALTNSTNSLRRGGSVNMMVERPKSGIHVASGLSGSLP